MDCQFCTVCRRLSRMSLLIAVVMASLILSPMKVSSKQLPDEECKPRPQVVAVEKHGFKPYHIKLYRCSGTCDKSPPTHRPCTASQRQLITLDLIDLSSGAPTSAPVENHTKCGCDCELPCDGEEYLDTENCKCKTIPSSASSGRKTSDPVDILPYQVGMAIVGFFALCVLVIDMIMCGKDKGVLYKVKEQCCKPDQTDGKGLEMTEKNGNCTSPKGNPRPVEV